MLYNRTHISINGLHNRRRVLPPAEILLWERLRDDRLDHLHFARQRILGDHIVDFYCSTARVVIEVDARGVTTERDRERIKDLQSKGMCVLRFAASSVYDDVEAVVNLIQGACKATEAPVG